MRNITVEVKMADNPYHIPEYADNGSSGCDLKAIQSVFIPAKEVRLVRTGLYVAIPEGYEAQVRSRSGLALKNQIFVINSPGTIDSSYRGEIGVILANFGNTGFLVEEEARIAQLVIAPVVKANFVEVLELDSTERGEGGFGHSGV